MLVVNRFRIAEADGPTFRAELQAAHEVLALRPGYLGGTIGRNVDDPTLWVLSTSWQHVGAYRRAIGSYEAKLAVVPTLGRAIDEPSAFEDVEPGTELNIHSTRSPDGSLG